MPSTCDLLPSKDSRPPAARYAAGVNSCVFSPPASATRRIVAWEREYKLETCARWQAQLGREQMRDLLLAGKFSEIAARAVRVEQQSRHSMIFSFEKMALRDAVKSPAGARDFARGLYRFLHGRGSDERRFTQWCATVAALPRRQTRVLTWPLVTVFGFIAQPDRHMFLKPLVTRTAARAYGLISITHPVRTGRPTGTCWSSPNGCVAINATCDLAT